MILDTFRLDGKVALVTGTSRGLGQAAAVALAEAGADVALLDRSLAQETAEKITALGRRVHLVRLDLVAAKPEELDAAVQSVVDALGRIDILVNNAGFQMARRESMADITTEDLDRTMRTNLYAMFWVTQTALEHLGSGASIINTTSIQAYQPSTSLLDYASTKAAITNFTVNLAAEVGPKGIRVNAVAPGPIWTPLQPATQPVAKLEKFGSDTPLGRAGMPAEVAPAYVFLAADSTGSYVSGTVLGVTGGKPVF